MKKSKQKKLKETGWQVGKAEEFLGMTPEEIAYLKSKLTHKQKRSEIAKAIRRNGSK